MAFIKLVIFGFIGLSIIYLSVSLFARSVYKERLENEFDAEHADGAEPGARDAFVSEGMIAYGKSVRPKLVGLVYIVPTVVVGAIIYTINAS